MIIQIPIEPPDDDQALFKRVDERAQQLQTDDFMAISASYADKLVQDAADLIKATGEPYGSDVYALLAASSAFAFGYALAQVHAEQDPSVSKSVREELRTGTPGEEARSPIEG